MNKYKILYENGSIEECESLFSAYSKIDPDGVFLKLKDYVDVKWLSVYTCDEFINFIESLKTFSDLISSQIQARYNIQDLSEVYVLTTGSNDTNTSKNIIVLNNESFRLKFNSLLSNLGYQATIEKNDELIKENIKTYFVNHIKTFLDVTDYLISKNLYNNKWTHNYPDNLDELGINKADNFNDNEPYYAIVNQQLCSNTQFNVLTEFMSDIDLIIDIIINNNDMLVTSQLEHDFIQLIR